MLQLLLSHMTAVTKLRKTVLGRRCSYYEVGRTPGVFDVRFLNRGTKVLRELEVLVLLVSGLAG